MVIALSKIKIPQVTVEPIAVFMLLGFQIWLTCFQTGLYQVVCYQLYHNQTNVDCSSTITDKNIQNKIQQSMAQWYMVLMLAYIIPGTVSSCILGAWSDSSGRKTNLLSTITGLIIAVFPLSFIFTFKLTPLWILAIVHFIGGSMGFIVLLFTASMAYLSDISLDRKTMTIRMVVFHGFGSIASVVGSALSGSLLGRLDLPIMTVIVQALFVISFFYVLLRLHQLPPDAMKRKIEAEQAPSKPIVAVIGDKKPDYGAPGSDKKLDGATKSVSLLCNVKSLIVQTVKTYTKQRAGHRRVFLIVTAAILFLHIMADTGLKGNIVGQYVFKDPFNWTDGSKLGFWRAASGLLAFVGNIAGIVIFKKLLQFSDTLIMLISIASSIAELIVLGIAQTEWMLYLAIVVGCLGNMLMPVMSSFTTQLVDTDEVGKSLVAHGLAFSLAFIASTIFFQNVYQATLEIFAGFVFVFGAGMMTFCFMVMFWVHLLVVRQNKIADKIVDAKKPASIF